uniref:Uncharacterized protein n=1 Tax=Eutreptiella gymnastica TaxID=73025 RepID=A0A6U7YAC7_9EUGL
MQPAMQTMSRAAMQAVQPPTAFSSGLMGVGATSASPDVQMQYATYVKEALRGNNDLKLMWHQHCRLYAEGSRDPARHTAESLQMFINQAMAAAAQAQAQAFGLPDAKRARTQTIVVDAMAPGEDPEARRNLITQIKELQRQSSEWKSAWGTYCDMSAAGTRDPTAHASHVLQQFLDQAAQAGFVPQMPPVMPFIPVLAPAIDVANPEHERYVRMVKDGQGKSEVWKTAWAEYCMRTANGSKDPKRHDLQSLQIFCDSNASLLDGLTAAIAATAAATAEVPKAAAPLAAPSVAPVTADATVVAAPPAPMPAATAPTPVAAAASPAV